MVSIPSRAPCMELVSPQLNNFPLQLQLHRPKHNLPPTSSQSVKLLHPQPNHSNGFSLTKKKSKKKGFIPARSTISDVLRLMDGLGFSIPIDMYVSLIEECTVSGDPHTSMELHAHITRSRINPLLSFINRLLLIEMHFYAVLNDFKEMGRRGIRKNIFAIPVFLKRMEECQAMDTVVNRSILTQSSLDLCVECGLIDMYGRSGLVREAKLVFEMIHNRTNMACWNAMLMGCMQNGLYLEAIKLLYQMTAGLQPQESLLKELRIACGGYSRS